MSTYVLHVQGQNTKSVIHSCTNIHVIHTQVTIIYRTTSYSILCYLIIHKLPVECITYHWKAIIILGVIEVNRFSRTISISQKYKPFGILPKKSIGFQS